ncbi:MAG: excinuclease ABC subunit A, partial [Arenicella sp.]
MLFSKKQARLKDQEYLEVYGARVHNLKNIDVRIPREKLVVITGLSGSGKSSLAFDTIYAEGQRRYIETFSAYARQFLGGLERPDVDKIDGLSPVISIEQKTTNKSPRSTVGTITEIYDFLRLLFARAADAYSYNTNQKMVSYSDEQIKNLILKDFDGKKIAILAPLIKSRKGHYRELFEQISKQGFIRVRVDGKIQEIEKGMKLDRYKTHDIEVVIDRLAVNTSVEKRLEETIKTALYSGDNILMVIDVEDNNPRYFSRELMCPTTGIAYPNPEPNTFSFNSPKGACNSCNGLGITNEINLNKVIPDATVSIKKGGIAPLGEQKSSWIFKQIENIAERYQFKLTDSIKDIPKEALEIILNGGNESFEIESKTVGVRRNYKIDFEGIIAFIDSQYNNAESTSIKRWAKGFMDEVTCSSCQGKRLKKEALHFKITDKNISDLVQMDVTELANWFKNVEKELSKKQLIIASEILKEIGTRIQFLVDVGL